MTFDSQLGQVVLFGGSTISTSVGFVELNDAWSWDGFSWTQLALPAAPPAPFPLGGLVYGDSPGGLLLIGADLSLSVLKP
jgi:hypothetical protein